MGKSNERFKGHRNEAIDKQRRKATVAITGQDPVMEAEMHVLVAEQKLLDLSREAKEAAAAQKTEEASSAAEAAPAAAEDAGELN